MFSSNVRNLEDDSPYGWPGRHDRNINDINSKIMLTAIGSLSLVIVLVIALHVYARCVLRRQARRRAALRHLGLTVAHARSGEQPNRGLDPTIIALLPVFVFRRKDGEVDDATSATECAVCLSMIENEEMARLLPNCKHVFHAECIDKWLGSHSTCPICRAEAEPAPLVQPERREAPAGPAGGFAPTAPPQSVPGFSCMEGTSDGAEKVSGSSLRLNSFKRILTGERSSSRRVHSRDEDDVVIEDLERQ
ncbi:E3 ubiquitin-protein ligase ATL41-like [Corylus avellana]|uniref:E3 ubiquitin-protein ligase ATL41-like n=1 Tax=Corylus avellana TaxID=13451 RepID=UPI001E21EBE3|nr:E3 ubiquitin-protein ligase ATL41-like [Corylus avellana]